MSQDPYTKKELLINFEKCSYLKKCDLWPRRSGFLECKKQMFRLKTPKNGALFCHFCHMYFSSSSVPARSSMDVSVIVALRRWGSFCMLQITMDQKYSVSGLPTSTVFPFISISSKNQ